MASAIPAGHHARLEFRPVRAVPACGSLFTSGYPECALTPSQTLEPRQLPYTPAELARRVRELLDDAAVS